MTAIRLEKFIHPARIAPSVRTVSHEEIAALQKEAHESGVKEGAAAASAAFLSEETRCLSRIEEAIADAYFSREDAHRLALASLQPLITSLVETIAPALAEHSLAAEINAVVQQHVESTADECLEVFVSKGLGAGSVLNIELSPHLTKVSEDPALSEGQARVCWGGGFDLIDLDATNDAVKSAIDDFFSELTRPMHAKEHHGT